MTQVGEGIVAAIVKLLSDEYLFAAIAEVTFASGIPIFGIEAGGAETELPAAGTPHWGTGVTYPAVYVREGGTGGTNTLTVKVEWSQKGRDGSAKLKGESVDGLIVIEGDFSISGERGDAVVNCSFTKRPTVVANYGRGIGFVWTVTAGGQTVDAPGASMLELFFVDAEPKPVGWSEYQNHYLRIIDWATAWAAGAAGEAAVFAALWGKFSNGTRARVPHVTGFSYWKTTSCAQNLINLLDPSFDAHSKGWSCRAIAHTFMACLSLHGIRCLEVIPNTAGGTRMFLVHNWQVDPSPTPNWENGPDLYYAGSWVDSSSSQHYDAVSSSLTKYKLTGYTTEALSHDMRKVPGVPAQGQNLAPLGFINHWIVEVGGLLYDTSYGLRHPNSMTTYASNSLGGWLIDTLPDQYQGGFLWLTTKTSRAFRTYHISRNTLVRHNGSSN